MSWIGFLMMRHPTSLQQRCAPTKHPQVFQSFYEEILGAHFENASQARECNQRLGEVAATVQQDVLLMAVSATFLML